MEKKVSKVTLNGVTLMDIHEDTVQPETLAKDETSHDRSGEQITGEAEFGGDTTDCYKITDPASNDIDDADYIPFHDVSDSEVPKKKTLFSNIIEKLKNIFMAKQMGNGNDSLVSTNYYLGIQDNSIDASKADNNISEIHYPSTFRVLDKEGRTLAVVEGYVKPDGDIGLKLYVQNFDSNGNTLGQKVFQLNADKNGASYYNITDGDKLLSAVGSGYCEGTKNGSAITATIAGFKLTKGGVIVLKMSSALPENATLNINSTGAKPIYWENGTALRGMDMANVASANTWILMYDGDHYVICGVNKAAMIGAQSYVADTSGNITLNAFYGSNAFQLKYRLPSNTLAWNRYINGAWVGDKRLLDEDDFASNMYSLAHGKYIDIPANTDLDTLTDSGTYLCRTQATAQTLTNCPETVAFKMVVDYMNNAYIVCAQVITVQNARNKMPWRRLLASDGIWGPWYQFATKSELLDQSLSIGITYGDLNDYKTPGFYYWSDANYPNITNTPPNRDSYNMYVMSQGGQSYVRQIAFKRGTADQIWTRNYADSTWSPWNYIGSIVDYGYNLADNVDLNDYKIPGVYNIPTNARAATISNIPVQQAGKLIVLNVAGNNYKIQCYIVYNLRQNGSGIFFRYWINDSSADTWSHWFNRPSVYKQGTFVDDTSGYVTIHSQPENTNHAFQFKFDVRTQNLVFNGCNSSGTWIGDSTVYTNHTPPVLYCTCDTAASTAAKVATPVNSNSKLRGLRYGQIVAVTYTNSNTASSCTLNVDGSGAKSIYYGASVYANSSTNICGYANGTIYYMWDGTYWRWLNVSRINDTVRPGTYYGTCSSAAGDQTKAVTVSDTSFTMAVGTIVGVKFTNSNSYSATSDNHVKLDVNSKGAKNIYFNTGYPTGTSNTAFGYANRTNFYMYNGADWVWLNYGTEADTYTSAYCSTGGGTAAKAASMSGYSLLSKSHVMVTMTNSNTVKGALTLNINGKGAKPIYINGSASSSSNYTLPAGSYLVYYNGTNYYFRTDGKITCAGTVTV